MEPEVKESSSPSPPRPLLDAGTGTGDADADLEADEADASGAAAGAGGSGTRRGTGTGSGSARRRRARPVSTSSSRSRRGMAAMAAAAAAASAVSAPAAVSGSGAGKGAAAGTGSGAGSGSASGSGAAAAAAAGASSSSAQPQQQPAHGFHRRGQDWFYTTGLPSDVVIEVDDVSFHLHKFPLLARSAKLADMVSRHGEGKCVLQLEDIPGGAHAFEVCAKFCYGVRVELAAGNVPAVFCAADWLLMTEEVAEGNLVAKADAFLDQVVLRSWRDSVRALHACQAPNLAPHAERLGIVRKCVDALAARACADPGVLEQQQPTSPGGSILWNGISTGAVRAGGMAGGLGAADWWYSDLATLHLHFYEQVISALQAKGMRAQSVAGAVVHYAKKNLPGLQKRHAASGNLSAESGKLLAIGGAGGVGEPDPKLLLETLERLLPMQKGVCSCRFLFGMLRSSMILGASPLCKSSLERRIGLQLEQATLDDLLMPNYSYSVETLYDVETVQRILDHFLLLDQAAQPLQESGASPLGGQVQGEVQLVGSPSLNPVFIVAKLLDVYLAEVAPDVNLKPAKFQALAEALPDYARLMDDGLYRAVDIYLKAHPWLMEHERERLCRVMDCQKLSLEACTHAAQNERLPLRVVVQVLFFEQLQLRTAIAGCFHVADPAEQNSRPSYRSNPGGDLSGNILGPGIAPAPQAGAGGPWANVVRENQVLKVDMDKMRARVHDLERECAHMRTEIQKLGKSKRRVFKSFDLTKLGCSRQADSGLDSELGTGIEHPPFPKPHRRHNTALS